MVVLNHGSMSLVSLIYLAYLPLHAETDEYLIMVLEGPLSELMVKVDLSLYRKYFTTNSKGKPLLYVKMNKSLYGMIRCALLL